MWWFRWHSRRFFRSIMAPMDPQTAVKWEKRLRLLYIFVGFNAAVFTIKHYFSEKDELKNGGYADDTSHAHKKVRQMSPGGNMRVVSMGIGKPTQVFDVNTEEYRQEFNEKQTENLKKAMARHLDNLKK